MLGVYSEAGANSAAHRVSISFVFTLCINCCLAVTVNLTSTWCAAHCSSLMYGVLGQAKTLSTIVIGACFFNVVLTFRSFLCLSVSLSAVLIFMRLESRSSKATTSILPETHVNEPVGRSKSKIWMTCALGIGSSALVAAHFTPDFPTVVDDLFRDTFIGFINARDSKIRGQTEGAFHQDEAGRGSDVKEPWLT